MDDRRQKPLRTLVDWTHQHITGDEKGEAQVFLDRLLQAFGHGGVREVGAKLEMRVRSNDRKGTAFADLVWKPYVLIEMKKRGEDLSRHYRQAFDYWTHLVPNRPRFVILWNFDGLAVYKFQTEIDVHVDEVALNELPMRYDALSFVFRNDEESPVGNQRENAAERPGDWRGPSGVLVSAPVQYIYCTGGSRRDRRPISLAMASTGLSVRFIHPSAPVELSPA